jgi:hypothetical protein
LKRYLSFKKSKATASAGTDTSSPRPKLRARCTGDLDSEQLNAEDEDEDERGVRMKKRKFTPKHSQRDALLAVSASHRPGELEDAKTTL